MSDEPSSSNDTNPATTLSSNAETFRITIPATASRGPSREAAIASGAHPGTNPGSEHVPTLADLDAIINDCRTGTLPKSVAARKILASMDRIVSLSPSSREETFESYLTEINAVERQAIQPAVAPLASRQQRSPEPEAPIRGQQRSNGLAQEGEDLLFATRRRVLDAADDPDDENAHDAKRRRAGQVDMPWHGIVQGRASIDRTYSCARTCELLELYGEDLPRCKFLVRTAPYAPEGIPQSQWERILRGESLNLDHFLSSIVRTTIDEERQARIGTTQLTFNTTEAKRKVKSSHDWAAAWRRASEAVSFAFPHRREELDLYHRHIQSEFDVKQPGSHHRIIAYDVAVRNYVGGGQTSVLTDRDRFSHLYSAIVVADGIEFSASTRKTPTSVSKSTEVCNKYNTTTGCPHAPCRYRHSCKGCGEDGHGQPACTTKPSK